MKADREASNAIVQLVSYYSGALGRLQADLDLGSKHNEGLSRIISDQQTEVTKVRADLKQAQDEAHASKCELGTLTTKSQNREGELLRELKDARDANATLRTSYNNVADQKAELASKFESLRIENERLQRVNIESHNERDKNVKSLRDASEALGWFKGEAHRFIKELGEILGAKGFVINNGNDVLNAVRKMADAYNYDPDAPLKKTVKALKL